MFSIFFRKYRDAKKKENQLVYFDHQNVNSLCLRHHYVNSTYSEVCDSIEL